ncbi:Ubiquinone biosynthesis O-methyltransferase [uncultured archaeon]|nr:Ubiquinone biosynthesis O-methyltransferase [uncultured archaeon]
MENAEKIVQQLLSLADVKIGGNRPGDIKVNTPEFYSRVLGGGSLALGESYMDGWWDCKELDVFFDKILHAEIDKKAMRLKNVVLPFLKAKLTNMQTKSKAKEVGEKHYDVGNDLYKLMLDKRMCYSCGYWKNAKTLDEAQEAKLDLICKKLKLKKGMKVLDIGCGWGSFAKFAAEKYGVKVVGITISKEQAKLAQERCEGLPVEIRLEDYRNITEKFDRILSIGMFEHVGPKNYKEYMTVVHRCLNDEGLMMIHTIAGNKSVTSLEPWFHKYIFPNGVLPSAKQITTAAEGLFILEDWHSFGQYYDNTLMAWLENFKKNWGKIENQYNERFYRMWVYYLSSCAGSFRAKKNQLWQIVYSKIGSTEFYERVC